MEELLEEEDQIRGARHHSKHTQLGESWQDIHHKMQSTLQNPILKQTKVTSSSPYPHSKPTLLTNQKHHPNRIIFEQPPSTSQVFKKQLAKLQTLKEVKTPERGQKRSEKKGQSEKMKQGKAEKEKAKLKSDKKIEEKSQKKRQGTNEKDVITPLLLNSQTSTKQFFRLQTTLKPSKYRITKAKSEHIDKDNLKVPLTQFQSYNIKRVNLTIQRAKSLPQFVHPSEPFNSKQPPPIHASHFYQRVNLMSLGASNNVLCCKRIKQMSLTKYSSSQKQNWGRHKNGCSKQGVTIKRSLDQRQKRIFTEGKKSELKLNLQGNTKDWLRIDKLGLT